MAHFEEIAAISSGRSGIAAKSHDLGSAGLRPPEAHKLAKSRETKQELTRFSEIGGRKVGERGFRPDGGSCTRLETERPDAAGLGRRTVADAGATMLVRGGAYEAPDLRTASRASAAQKG